MVRSNDRYDKYCDELCDELLDDEDDEGMATSGRDQRINDHIQDVEDVDQTEMEIEAQLL